MKQISLADAARRTTSIKTKLVAEDSETDEEYFKRVDAKVMQKTNELLVGDCTREQLAKIAAEYMVCFVELVESHSQTDKLREETKQRLEEHVKLLRELGDLREHHGKIDGLRMGLVVSKKAQAKKGANARHAEHRKLKADVFAWLDLQPKFSSIESAAAAIVKQQPIKHVTGRDWYKEWKKLRSASSP